MGKHLLEVDTEARSYEVMHYDDQERKVHIEIVQDVGPHLERAKRLRADESHKARGIKNGRLQVATLPNVVINKWLNEKRIPPNYLSREGTEAVMKILRSDPEYQYLRTTTGKI